MKNTHKHKCEDCGVIWEHSDSCHGSDEAHKCPACGAMLKSGFQYSGPNEPAHHGVCLAGHHIPASDKIEAEILEFSRSMLGRRGE